MKVNVGDWVLRPQGYVDENNCYKPIIVKILSKVYHEMHSDLYLCEIPLFGRKRIFFSWQFDPITFIRVPGKISNGV